MTLPTRSPDPRVPQPTKPKMITGEKTLLYKNASNFPQTVLGPGWLVFTYIFIRIILAEVPGAARVNLQPAEHLLFCKQLLGFQAPQAQMW